VAGAVLLQSLINASPCSVSRSTTNIAVGGVVLGAAFISRFQK